MDYHCCLEEIRFSNFKMDSYSPMSLILLGRPELRRILQIDLRGYLTTGESTFSSYILFSLSSSIRYLWSFFRWESRINELKIIN